jgi:hypothetical protein
MSVLVKAFPHLEKLPDKYQKENLRSLGTTLEEPSTEQTREEIEVFGVKIPSGLIALFGLPIIAILPFQFSAIGFYAASNADRFGQEETSEWSFLLGGWPFELISAGAIFGVPTGTSILTFLFLSRGDWLSKLPYLFCSVIVIITSAAAFLSLQRIRARSRLAAELQPAEVIDDIQESLPSVCSANDDEQHEGTV